MGNQGGMCRCLVTEKLGERKGTAPRLDPGVGGGQSGPRVDVITAQLPQYLSLVTKQSQPA